MSRVQREMNSLGKLHGNGYVYKVDNHKKTRRVKKSKKKLVTKGKRTKNNLHKV